MAALAVNDRQIGMIASVFMLFRALSSILSGAITDKLGRKRATFIFDVISWSIPCIMWTFAQNYWWFVVAAAFNGLSEITGNSWHCLLVEDAEKSAIVSVYSWVHISGQLAVFFAPLAGILVESMTIVPAVRILYAFTFFSMTLKFFILNRYCDETKVGRVRMEETAGMSIMAIMSGYGQIWRKLRTSRAMILALSIVTFFTVTNMVVTNFFGLYITRSLLLPQSYLAYFPIIRAIIILAFIFIIQPKIGNIIKAPMLTGILMYIAAYALLLIAPQSGITMPIICVVLESCAYGIVVPRKDSIAVLFVDRNERARLISVMTFVVLVITIPFGVFSGWLSDTDARLPFVLTIVIFVIQFIVVARSRLLSNASVKAIEEQQIESSTPTA
jgi:MFS family permease